MTQEYLSDNSCVNVHNRHSTKLITLTQTENTMILPSNTPSVDKNGNVSRESIHKNPHQWKDYCVHRLAEVKINPRF